MHIRFIIAAVLAYLLIQLYSSFTVYETLSLSLFLYLILSFLNDLGKKLAILDIVVLTTMIICLLMPIAGYHFFNSQNRMAHTWNWYMRVPSEQYYSFMFPATVAMIIGLKVPIFFRKKTFSFHEQYMINAKAYLADVKWQGLILVVVGLAASVIRSYVPTGIATIFLFISFLMFVGMFYCLYSNFPNKKAVLTIVFGIMIVRSVSAGMFGELVFMSVMTIILVLLGNKMQFITKVSLFALGLFSIVVLQSVKPAFRAATWHGNVEGSKLSIFADMLSEKIANPSSLFENETGVFAIYIRFNQGQIISRVLDRVPERVQFADGETIFKSLAGTLVPRFLWPDKPEAGGAYNFQRFLGIRLRGYSMNISPFGEAYANFGMAGGVVFMLFFGLIFNFFFALMLKFAVKYPSLILWFPFLFFYAVKIETDVGSMLNSLTKAAFFTYLVYRFFPVVFKMKI